MSRRYALVFLFLSPLFGMAQSDFVKLRSVPVGAVHMAGIDRVGELYLVQDKGVQRLSVEGEVVASASLASLPSLIDPRDGSHIFFFWKKNLQYEFRLPDLYTSQGVRAVDSSFAIAPVLVCPSGDHELLVLDSADWSVKKVDPATGRVLYETILFSNPPRVKDLTYMREYQNFIFILEREKGIHIFNRMGRYLRTLPGKNIPHFNFIGGELYFPEKDSLRFFDLFTAEERSIIIPAAGDYIFLTDERLFVVAKGRVEIFSVPAK